MATIYSKDFAICPWCEAQTDSAVSHLYDEVGRSFGPWYCSECHKPFCGRVNAPHDVDIWMDENNRESFTRAMCLLRLDGKDGPVFFVMDHDHYRSGDPETNEEYQDHTRYFFEEHSCPTNWLQECVAVIERGDCDPHGFLTFVRAVDVPEDFNEHDDDEWPLLFPEAFGGEIIEGRSRTITGVTAAPKSSSEQMD